MGKQHYGLKPIQAQDALNELCEYLLGKDYYIVDPLNNSQANAIIVDDIKAKYPPVNSGLVSWLRWKFGRMCRSRKKNKHI